MNLDGTGLRERKGAGGKKTEDKPEFRDAFPQPGRNPFQASVATRPQPKDTSTVKNPFSTWNSAVAAARSKKDRPKPWPPAFGKQEAVHNKDADSHGSAELPNGGPGAFAFASPPQPKVSASPLRPSTANANVPPLEGDMGMTPGSKRETARKAAKDRDRRKQPAKSVVFSHHESGYSPEPLV